MLEVISPALKRQLQVIQYLYQKREPYRTKELVELLKASEKTIRADINHINENFTLLNIEIGSNGQVKLNCSDYIGIEYVYRKIMGLSLEFKIFEYLLSNSDRSISEYLKKFFVSDSMFRRIIQKWNKAFEKRGLPVTIDISPVVTIQGNEMVVRQLYYRYFIEKYEGDFQNAFWEKNGSIWEFITRVWNILEMKISYSTHLKLSYWVFVSIQRVQKGYFVEKEYTEAGEKIAQLLCDKISKDIVFMEQFMYDNHVRLSVELLVDMMEIHDFDLLLLERLKKDISSYEQKETGLSLVAIKEFLFSLFESVGYHDLTLEKTSISVYNSLVFLNEIPFFFYDPYQEFKAYVKTENPQFVAIFENLLEESALPSAFKQKDELKNELLYYVVIHSESLLERVAHLTSQKKILILTTYYYKYMFWLKGKIERRFARTVAVSLYQSYQLQFDREYLSQFDIILTNYDRLPSEFQDRTIYLDVGVSATFWEKIERKLK